MTTEGRVGVRHLLFDLDDTLYTDSSGLFIEVGDRIRRWTAEALGVSLEEAQDLRREYYKAYGTTMAGLLRHHPEVDIDAYLEYVHDVDVSRYLAINSHEGVVWYNKERMDSLIWWLLAVAMLEIAYDDYTTRGDQEPEESPETVMTRVLRAYDCYERWRNAHASAGFRVDRLLELLDEPNVEADS